MSGGWDIDRVLAFSDEFFNFLKHVRVNSKEMGQIVLGEHVYRAQKMMLDDIFEGLSRDKHDFKVLKSRQLGVSTVSRALTLFWIGVHTGLKGYMVFDTDGHKEEARLELIGMIEMLPPDLGFPGIKRQNRYLLELDNGSMMNFASAGVKSSKGSGVLGRSSGINFVHASEMCSWDNVEGLESFKNALAEDFPDRLYLWESTARGFNQWHDMWEEAKKDPLHQKTMFYGWWAKDNQMIPRSSPEFEVYGRDPPSENEQKKIAAVKTQYGWTITDEQLAWIRRKMDPTAEAEGDAPADYDGDPLRVQEQPWCVTRETRVGTNRGLIRIEDVREGGNATLGKIIKAGPTGFARIWKARTKLGYEIRGTGNHPLISSSGDQIRLDQSLGHTVKLQPPSFADDIYVMKWRQSVFDFAVTITPDLARFVGLFMGDGSASWGHEHQVREVSICCGSKDEDVIEECGRLFRTLFDVDAHENRSQPGWVSVRSGSKRVFGAVKQLGLTRNDTVKTQRRVYVPEFIWRSPKHVVREFLSGLFEADGYNGYDTHRVALFSKYPDFIREIQLLLLGFGITSRSVLMQKKRAGGDGHPYTGNQLELRKAEAIRFNEEIGFISERKRNRHEIKKYHPKWENRAKPEIVFEDVIASVRDEGVEEQVFNLTVEGDHLFDANGILTHNTEEEAFQMTGATFFEPERLTEIANTTVSKKFKAHTFVAGLEFSDCKWVSAYNQRSIELKVWEEPVDDAIYVIASDVAFGINEKNDRSATQVLRCYADGIDQVAEYAWPLINSKQYAWVIASLLGWYGSGTAAECYLILELNGPGEATWNELQSLKRELQYGYQRPNAEERGLQNIFGNVRNYIYGRSDSMSPGRNWQFLTNTRLKVSIMERLRDFTSNKMLTVRSHDTVEEMKAVTRDGDSIEAQGSKKDDRVLALALGIRCWEDRARRNMLVQRRTRSNEEAKRRMTIRDQIQVFNEHQLTTFFTVKQQARRRAEQAAARAGWRGAAPRRR